MRFWMRYTCFSSLRQGNSRQAPLISSVSVGDDVFLSAILLALHLPYSRVYVCISDGFPIGFRFLDHPHPCGIGWIPTCFIDPSARAEHGVPPFRVIVCRC